MQDTLITYFAKICILLLWKNDATRSFKIFLEQLSSFFLLKKLTLEEYNHGHLFQEFWCPILLGINAWTDTSSAVYMPSFYCYLGYHIDMLTLLLAQIFIFSSFSFIFISKKNCTCVFCWVIILRVGGVDNAQKKTLNCMTQKQYFCMLFKWFSFEKKIKKHLYNCGLFLHNLSIFLIGKQNKEINNNSSVCLLCHL